MTIRDLHGHSLSGANAAAAEHFDAACALLRCYRGDPLAAAMAALEQAPRMTMAHVLVAYLNLLGTEPAGLAAARDAQARAAMLPADEREALHVRAAGCLAQGRWHEAGRVLEDLSIRYPHDLLALQVGHQVDFFTGRSRMLRDRIARAESHWHEGMPGHHAVLAMLAFGLEETADYARAERLGRRSVELEPHDGWGWHAVAHVLEMQGRRSEGIAWLRRDSAHWSEGSFFAVHNWWHLALFHLGLDQLDEVFTLLDERVLGTASPVVLDMIDASALLWRLQLRGVPVGERWQALATRWAAASEGSAYAFNDFHAMLAFVGADRMADARRLLEAQREALQQAGDNAAFLRDVGHPATLAIHDFALGRHAEAARRLREVRPVAHRFGGSHAQRDLIDLTLIEAARRGGDAALADALQRERAFVRRG
ncbi:MAG: tetratricopeptide repeat protein [Piscinibacter sp.]|uniref:tetratricopeptide repeat protein n=1 Tax=Piscinibacter sp. TaxID=1903157 RepID=UPI00258543B6|nr:tetratricopeptide repeat protein [Piscinibacter sp.]MCW5666113.1 tetratricopeptide repeat protein [Piscinibacter sp.]